MAQGLLRLLVCLFDAQFFLCTVTCCFNFQVINLTQCLQVGHIFADALTAVVAEIVFLDLAEMILVFLFGSFRLLLVLLLVGNQFVLVCLLSLYIFRSTFFIHSAHAS